MVRGNVIIIPNEDKIEDEYFETEIEMNHIEGFQRFSDHYNLGYKFDDDAYQDVPLLIAKEGHLAIKTIDGVGVALFYIPEVVTPRQFDWMRKNLNDFVTVESMGGFAIRDNSIQMPDIIRGMYNLKEEVRRRHELYEYKGKKM